MDVSLDVLYGVIDNLMDELRVQSFIGFQGVRKDFGSWFNMRLDVSLEGLFLGSSPKSVIEGEVSFMQRLAWEVVSVNPRFI